MLLLSPKTSKDGQAALTQENSSKAPQATSCPSPAHSWPTQSQQLIQAVISHPSAHRAPATIPAQGTTTTKDTEPGFEAVHREDRLLQKWYQFGEGKSSSCSGPGETDNSVGTAHMCLASGVAKVAGGLTRICYSCRRADSAGQSLQLALEIFRPKPWTCATCDITSCTEASAGLFLS